MIRGIPVKMLDELPEFAKENTIDIAALTIPKENAETTAVMLSSLGIHAIWNFAHVDLDNVDNMIVENVHLSDSLMRLSYSIANGNDQ